MPPCQNVNLAQTTGVYRQATRTTERTFWETPHILPHTIHGQRALLLSLQKPTAMADGHSSRLYSSVQA